MGNDDDIRYIIDGKEVDFSEYDKGMYQSQFEDPRTIYGQIDWELKQLDITFRQLEQGYFLDLKEQAKNLLKQKNEPLTADNIEDMVRFLTFSFYGKTPSFLVKSFLVILFTMFEDFIRRICKLIREQHNVPISDGMIKGNIVERSKNYLVIFGKFKKQDEIWKTVSEIYTIRNMIAHNNYEKEKITNRDDRKNLNSLIKKKCGISFKKGTIMIEKKFGNYALETIRAFFQSLKDEHLKNLPGQRKPQLVKK
jgi:hypothetical protein